MVVQQYPHTATITTTTDGGVDDNGYQLPPITKSFDLVCRGEVNRTNVIVYLNDGTTYVYAYLIQIKKGQQDIPIGSQVSLQLFDRTVTGIAKMYNHDQLHARLWI